MGHPSPRVRSRRSRRVPAAVSSAAWATIAEVDPGALAAMEAERRRQSDKIELIASENYVHAAVLEAQGSWLTNKYAEGLPGKRYYGGCEFVDLVEDLARERALALFPGSDHVNVQPHSGAQANMAAYFAVLKPGDRILGMNLAHGGHLTHGSPVNFSGRLYEVHAYGVDRETERLDYDAIADTADAVRPKVLVAGASAYPRTWDFERLASIAHGVGALLFVDMAHVAGLVAAGLHPSPFPHADLVTTTTHKTLRGPRGGVTFARADLPDGVDRADFPALGKSTLAQAIDKSVFPGHPGRPAHARDRGQGRRAPARHHRRVPARPGADHRERGRPLGDAGGRRGADRVGRDRQPPRARGRDPAGRDRGDAETLLDDVGITVNKNAIPFDENPPNIASGIRVGTPATTTRGMGPDEMRRIGGWIVEAIRRRDDAAVHDRIRTDVRDLVARFPGARAAARPRVGGPAAHAPDPGTREYLPYLIGALAASAFLALVLTPLVRRFAIRLDNIDRPDARRVNKSPSREAAGSRSRPPSCWSRSPGRRSTPRVDLAPLPSTLGPQELGALLPGVRSRPCWASSTTRSSSGPAGSSSGSCVLAGLAGRRRDHGRVHQQPVRAGQHPARRAVRGGVRGRVDRGHDQLDQLHRRPRRAVLGHRADRGRDARPDLAHDGRRTAVRRGPVLRPGRFPARVPALELPPGVDLHRHQRRDVRGLHARGAVDPRGRRRWPWPCWCSACPIIDTFWIIVRRLATGHSPFTPDRGHIHHRLLDLGLSHSQTVLVIYGLCVLLAVLSFVLSGTGQLYAFLGLGVVFGLVLFLVTRNETTDALEADTYDDPGPGVL